MTPERVFSFETPPRVPSPVPSGSDEADSPSRRPAFTWSTAGGSTDAASAAGGLGGGGASGAPPSWEVPPGGGFSQLFNDVLNPGTAPGPSTAPNGAMGPEDAPAGTAPESGTPSRTPTATPGGHPTASADETADTESGPETVRDAQSTARERADADHLADLVGRAIGAGTAIGPRGRAADTPGARRRGVLDVLLTGGVPTGDGGDLGPGMSGTGGASDDPTGLAGPPLAEGLDAFYDATAGGWVPNPLTPADVAWLEDRLLPMRAEFARLGREAWFDAVMLRLALLRRHAAGSVDVLTGTAP
jgi:hypothetical protein